jgi:hypothetical protein
MTDGGFARIYNAQLLCTSRPMISKSALIGAIRRYLPAARLADPDPTTDFLGIHHPDHPVEFAEGVFPAQTVVSISNEAPSGPLIAPALEQSWAFPNARDVVASCCATVMVTDLMSSSLPYQDRLLVQHVLRATLTLVDCAAIHWVPTQQVITPSRVFGGRCCRWGAALFRRGMQRSSFQPCRHRRRPDHGHFGLSGAWAARPSMPLPEFGREVDRSSAFQYRLLHLRTRRCDRGRQYCRRYRRWLEMALPARGFTPPARASRH